MPLRFWVYFQHCQPGTFPLKKFFNFVKIEHTLFTLPLIYSGVILGLQGPPDFSLLALVLFGPWMLQKFLNYTIALFESVPGMVH